MDSAGSCDALIRNQHVAQISAKTILALHHVPIENDSASIPRPNNDGNRSLPAVRDKNRVLPPKRVCIWIVQIGHGFADLVRQSFTNVESRLPRMNVVFRALSAHMD